LLYPEPQAVFVEFYDRNSKKKNQAKPRPQQRATYLTKSNNVVKHDTNPSAGLHKLIIPASQGKHDQLARNTLAHRSMSTSSDGLAPLKEAAASPNGDGKRSSRASDDAATKREQQDVIVSMAKTSSCIDYQLWKPSLAQQSLAHTWMKARPTNIVPALKRRRQLPG
jgi:hypothetical protein